MARDGARSADLRSACRAKARRYSRRGSGEGSRHFPTRPPPQTTNSRNELNDLLQIHDLPEMCHQNELVSLPKTKRWRNASQHSQQGFEQGLELGLGLTVRLAPGIMECCPR